MFGHTAGVETNQVIVRPDDTLDSTTKPEHRVDSRASRASRIEQNWTFVRSRGPVHGRREPKERDGSGAGLGLLVVQGNLDGSSVRD